MKRRRLEAWQYLIGIFAIFWLVFAFVLIAISQFPFIIISMALTTVAILSGLVVALAWAYTHNW